MRSCSLVVVVVVVVVGKQPGSFMESSGRNVWRRLNHGFCLFLILLIVLFFGFLSFLLALLTSCRNVVCCGALNIDSLFSVAAQVSDPVPLQDQ